jgi:tetratricopeptide (TPR) repeat protein
MGWSLNHQGDVAREQGDMAAAALLYEQAVAMFREVGDVAAIARSLADLGDLACDQGGYATAHRLYAEALMMFGNLGETRLSARVLESIAIAGAAAGFRQRFSFPLAASAKANLDACLEPAHRSLTTAAASAAWSEGWSMPLEKAIDYALAGGTQ